MAAHEDEQVRAIFAGEFQHTGTWFEVSMLITRNDGTLTYAIRKPGQCGVEAIISTDSPEIIEFIGSILTAVNQTSLSAD